MPKQCPLNSSGGQPLVYLTFVPMGPYPQLYLNSTFAKSEKRIGGEMALFSPSVFTKGEAHSCLRHDCNERRKGDRKRESS